MKSYRGRRIPSTDDEQFHYGDSDIYSVRSNYQGYFEYYHHRPSGLWMQIGLTRQWNPESELNLTLVRDLNYRAMNTEAPVEDIVERLDRAAGELERAERIGTKQLNDTSRNTSDVCVWGENLDAPKYFLIYRLGENTLTTEANGKKSVDWYGQKDWSISVEKVGQSYLEKYIPWGMLHVNSSTPKPSLEDIKLDASPVDVLEIRSTERRFCSVAGYPLEFSKIVEQIRWLAEDISDHTITTSSILGDGNGCYHHYCGGRGNIKASICGLEPFDKLELISRPGGIDSRVDIIVARTVQWLYEELRNQLRQSLGDQELTVWPLADILCFWYEFIDIDAKNAMGIPGTIIVPLKDDSGSKSQRELRISSSPCVKWSGKCVSDPVDSTGEGLTLKAIEDAQNRIWRASIRPTFSPDPNGEDGDGCQQHYCDVETATQVSLCRYTGDNSTIIDREIPLSMIYEKMTLLSGSFKGKSEQFRCTWVGGNITNTPGMNTGFEIGSPTRLYNGIIGEQRISNLTVLPPDGDWQLRIRKASGGKCEQI
ncbi:hypothetical protein ABW20_dc0106587 [Dactylellina cionopaga]|nr:hypothetical protein ABW20_dc0106587 [Dactylellina cionopaga]